MKYKYSVKKIDTRNINTPEEYWNAQRNAVEKHFDTMTEVRKYCGGKLHKERNGWCGFDGTYDYICTRI